MVKKLVTENKINEIEVIKESTNDLIVNNDYDTSNMIQVERQEKILEDIRLIGDVVKKHMIKGIDYGFIPGIPKPTLLQPGAEKLVIMFGLSARYEILTQEIDHKAKFIQYILKCKLVKLSPIGEEIIINEGYGAATNMEKAKNTANVDFGSLVNNLLKIAKKRALVDTVKGLSAVSGVFTQDMEDTAMANPKANDRGKLQIYRIVYKKLEIDTSKDNQKKVAKDWMKEAFNKFVDVSGEKLNDPLDPNMTIEQAKLWTAFISKEVESWVYNSKRQKIMMKEMVK